MIAYSLDGGGGASQPLPENEYSDMEAEYIAIIYGLNNYYLAWNRELDERQATMDTEQFSAIGEVEFAKAPKPSVFTRRPLPPPVLVICSREIVVKHLSDQLFTVSSRIHQLITQIWRQCGNIDIKFEWIEDSKNPARKMLI
jgi:hypothetical protein|tara:strand:+ start:46 stop:471 length:426 start_codon:yes stop_codon:yes gene_type:complete